MGGESGQIYQSKDGKQWKLLALPGNAGDYFLIALRDIAVAGNHVWLAGQPGNVVWYSDNLGESWSVRKTGRSAVNYSISSLNRDVVLTCGTMGSIHSSRNGGKAWWVQHQASSRSSVLNIVSTSYGVAWDLIAQVCLELRRSASLLVLHDQIFELRMGIKPDLDSRLDIAGRSIGASHVQMLPNFPVGNLTSGFRSSDLAYYHDKSLSNNIPMSSSIERRIAFELRNQRPDVVVTPCPDTGSSIEKATYEAVEGAIRLAERHDVRLFSQASGIPEETWKVQRTLVRGARPGLTYSPVMLFKSCGLVLGNLMMAVEGILDLPKNRVLEDVRYGYRIAGSKSGSMRDPVDGISLDPATQSVERSKPSIRLPALMSVCQLMDWKQLLNAESSSPLILDRVWESRLKTIAKDVSIESAGPVLLDIAVQTRRSGDWQRWQAALEILLEKSNNSASSDTAMWELMCWMGSAEIQQTIAAQLQAIEEHRTSVLASNAGLDQQTSPFAQSDRDRKEVRQVAFTSAVKTIPIASNKDLAEFARLLTRWLGSNQAKQSDPKLDWLIASRYRSMQLRNDGTLAGVNLQRNPSVFWPQIANHLPSWKQVSESERQLALATDADRPLNQRDRDTSEINRWTWIQERPYLDGKSDEAFWAQAQTIELRDPWTPNRNGITTIRFARDAEFLYLFSSAPFVPGSTGGGKVLNKEKIADSMSYDSDQIRLRIDLDRDYATWFELGWSSANERVDSVNDMLHWNPTWYKATSKTDSAWTAEIAIPINEICGPNSISRTDWSKQIWAMNAIRSVPSNSSMSIAPSISDRMNSDEWHLIQLGP
jgi:hypothetical protein